MQNPAKMAAAVANPDIFSVNAQSFQQSVLMASVQRPVLAYFTASWCGPCKQLCPTLEKVVTAQGGKVALAVIDIDQNPDLAAAMRVQSVPQVYAFAGGQPVDAFMGAQPESQIAAFVKKVLALMGGGQGAEDADAAEADNPFDVALALWTDGNLPAAMAAYKTIETDKPRAQKAFGFLQGLIAHAAAKAVAGSDAPSHHAAAMAALARGDVDAGFAALLASIKADRKWNEERARTDFVALSEILGLENEIVIANRKKLSSILFA